MKGHGGAAIEVQSTAARTWASGDFDFCGQLPNGFAACTWKRVAKTKRGSLPQGHGHCDRLQVPAIIKGRHERTARSHSHRMPARQLHCASAMH